MNILQVKKYYLYNDRTRLNAFVEKKCEQKELFSDLTVGRMNTIDKLHNSIDFNN